MRAPKIENANDALKYTAIAIIASFGIYKLYNSYNSGASQRADEAEAIKKGLKLSYPLTNYQGFADQIYQAGFEIGGTDEEMMYSIISKMKNDLDILALYKAFGQRRVEFSLQDTDLIGFLASELNTSEIKKVNDILMRNGLTFRF